MTSIFWSQSIILKPHCLDLNKNEWFIILHSMQNSDILHKNLWFGSSHFAKFLCKQPYEIFYAITKYFLAFVLDIFDFRFPLQKCKKNRLPGLKSLHICLKNKHEDFFLHMQKDLSTLWKVYESKTFEFHLFWRYDVFKHLKKAFLAKKRGKMRLFK